MTAPSSRSVLLSLPKARIVELGRDYGVAVPAVGARDHQVDLLLASGRVQFRELLGRLGRDELKSTCRVHELDDSGRARPELQARLLAAHGVVDSAPPPALFKPHEIPRYAPRPGDIVTCRHRQWLVEEVAAPPRQGHATRVRLVCLDDDDQGHTTDVLWELELGARVHQPEAHGLGAIDHVDPPRHFAAYLHALKWSSVTATDAQLFQSPFRAGIQLFDHQLTPLMKALSLPRANLFIADDVGLGKTIEAGLVMQELLLRQRIDLVVVVCPASVVLQWKGEMEKRFGLHFEVMSRAFIARRRQERGFGVNPWSTHNRFIISYPLIRRPEYRDPLLQHLSTLGPGDRARKSLLVLDEAHVAAPATASKYAVDSRITKVVRDIAPRFENRLFLSATPHNGHSNSFSALLEILDPQRFTRAVKVRDAEQLGHVMVRRLKEDLRALGKSSFPVRKLVQVALTHEGDRWSATERTWTPTTKSTTESDAIDLGPGAPIDLRLSQLLAEYTQLMRPAQGRGRLVFINLQKRLLSSVESFARTLRLHARSVEGKALLADVGQLDLAATIASSSEREDDDEHGPDDETLEAAEDAEVAASSMHLVGPAGRARALLDEMTQLAEQHRGAPDAKVRALIDWMRRHQCPGIQVGGAQTKLSPTERAWTDRRVLIFTEYGDTKRYLLQLLSGAVQGTDRADDRIMQLHGGMGDEAREEVQRAFNGPPDEYPVRILLATDAAREGVNLQGHCADLFHFDVPWNPARMEQRNGRIDRTLQSSPEVRCHYFLHPQRTEDRVVETLVKKVDVIQRELGSLGAVLMDRMDRVMADGIDERTAERLERAEQLHALKETTREELEVQRKGADALRAEIEEAGEILNKSRALLELKPALLRDAIDVGLELAVAGPLTDAKHPNPKLHAWKVPPLPSSWEPTLDTLRPARRRDEALWEWRKRAPQPVLFEPPPEMNSALVQLHLSHPFVRRILGRFLSQGYSAHDLSRVTIVKNPDDSLVRVIAFGRLSLFGRGAARLHDRLLSVGGRWIEGRESELKPFGDAADRNAVKALESLLERSPSLDGISPALQARVQAAAPTLFAKLWETLRADADAEGLEAIRKLKERGRAESDALRDILTRQRAAIDATLSAQLPLQFEEREKEERDQFEQDKKHLKQRLQSIDREIETEPPQIESLYDVALHRLEPVGLVVLWPETRG